MAEYGTNAIGEHTQIFENVILGFPSREYLEQRDFPGTTIGAHGTVRTGTVIYSDVSIGDHFISGHNVIIREHTTIGDRVVVGSSSIIEGHCTIGDDVRIQSMVYIPTDTTIGNGVFIGPNAVLTNDPYPPLGGERSLRPDHRGERLHRGERNHPSRGEDRPGRARGGRIGGDERRPAGHPRHRHTGPDKGAAGRIQKVRT